MAPRKKVLMAASGDLRQSANETCWPAQEAMEKQVAAALAAFDVEVERAHPYDPARKHGFIASQKEGLEIFSKIDPDTPIIVAEAVWQYTNHVLPGLIGHRAPILTVANWSGQWPGLVGMLNLNGSLTKAGVPYCTLWSETFADDLFKKKLSQWLQAGHVTHDLSHVHPFVPGRRAGSGPRGRDGCRLGLPPATRRSWAFSTRAAWGCTTPSSPTSSCSRSACSRSACRSRRSTRPRARSPRPRPAPSTTGSSAGA